MPRIITERLMLLPFNLEDAKEYFDVINAADIKHYVPYDSASTLEETRKLVDCYSKGDFINDFYFKILLKSTYETIGSIIAIKKESSKAVLDVSYLIGSKFRGSNYMKEALVGFINFVPFDYKYLRLNIALNNTASYKVAVACGAKRLSSNEHSSTFLIKLEDPFERL